MNKIMENLKNRLDFKLHNIAILPLVVLLLTYPAIKWLPVQYTYENSLLENLQLVVLLAVFLLCVKAKKDKNFYNSMALVAIILLLREVNCGRTIFFPIEGVDNAFYSWKEIKYGYLAHPLYGAFMFASGLYLFFQKHIRFFLNT